MEISVYKKGDSKKAIAGFSSVNLQNAITFVKDRGEDEVFHMDGKIYNKGSLLTLLKIDLLNEEGMKDDFDKDNYSLIPYKDISLALEKNYHDCTPGSMKEMYTQIIAYSFNSEIRKAQLLSILSAIRSLYESEFGFLSDLARVYTHGAKEYAPENWRKLNPERTISALGRHLRAGYLNIDKDSGLPHYVHIAWNAFTSYYLMKEDIDED